MPVRDTIVDRLMNNARDRGSRPAMYQKRGGSWLPVTWKQYADRARAFAGALLAEGYAAGDAVAIMGDNCPEWVIADVGAMMVRGVPAGIYQTCTAEQSAYIAAHCEAKVLVLEHKGLYARIAGQRATLPKLRKIVMIRDADVLDDPMVVSFERFSKGGAAHLDAVDARFAEIQDADLATLIYTSGTTGPPKAAMLSHDNMAFMAATTVAMNGTNENDCGVSYLPLSHIAEQALTIHISITAGQPVWFAEALDKVRDAMLAARPTAFMGVPRVWEKFRAALEPKLDEQTGLKGAIVRWSRAVGVEAGQHRIEHGAPTGLLAIKERVADRLFFTKLKTQLGLERLRLAASGAAPIGRDVLEFFLSVGITIHEVYGQTEGTGVSTFNRVEPRATKLGTVGRPLPGLEVKIAEDGEILVRGRSVFLGYFKDDVATAAAVQDGWLFTGDVGEIDRDGFLRITDRKKDLIITSGGKNVAPQNIEKLLRTIDGVGQAVVIGDRRKYLTALLTIDAEKGATVAKTHGWPTARAELAKHPAFIAHVQLGLNGVNQQLARYESVKKFTVLANDFTLETGELTPTQKVKRKVVCEKFAGEIEAMYADDVIAAAS